MRRCNGQQATDERGGAAGAARGGRLPLRHTRGACNSTTITDGDKA